MIKRVTAQKNSSKYVPSRDIQYAGLMHNCTKETFSFLHSTVQKDG